MSKKNCKKNPAESGTEPANFRTVIQPAQPVHLAMGAVVSLLYFLSRYLTC